MALVFPDRTYLHQVRRSGFPKHLYSLVQALTGSYCVGRTRWPQHLHVLVLSHIHSHLQGYSPTVFSAIFFSICAHSLFLVKYPHRTYLHLVRSSGRLEHLNAPTRAFTGGKQTQKVRFISLPLCYVERTSWPEHAQCTPHFWGLLVVNSALCAINSSHHFIICTHYIFHYVRHGISNHSTALRTPASFHRVDVPLQDAFAPGQTFWPLRAFTGACSVGMAGSSICRSLLCRMSIPHHAILAKLTRNHWASAPLPWLCLLQPTSFHSQLLRTFVECTLDK